MLLIISRRVSPLVPALFSPLGPGGGHVSSQQEALHQAGGGRCPGRQRDSTAEASAIM